MEINQNIMKIAIVEDDLNVRKSLETAFKDFDEYNVVFYKHAKEALKNLDDTVELVITDLTMPLIDGIEFLKQLDGKYEAIIITGEATLTRAIDAMRLGVKDFITKPFEIETLIEAIKRSKKVREVKKNKNLKGELRLDQTPFSVVSNSLKKPLEIATRASVTSASILLLGESGVGKEVFAKFIHNNSPRAKKPFIAINMAAIPETLIESELFGFEKGAFTDASSAKAGKFEEANGGTLFLDEIGEMPYPVQAKLLRALQEKEITRLGSTKPVKIDIRLVSATNQNIQDAVENGEFREDLYYRINTIPVEIPPLRDRKEEIIHIAKMALASTCTDYSLECKSFSDEALEELLRYRWPGNVRELISVCERAAILSSGDCISKDDLFIQSRESSKNISTMERDLLKEAYDSTDGNLEKISNILAIGLEDLKKKIKKYKIEN